VINGTGSISFKGDYDRAAEQRELLAADGINVAADWALVGWPAIRWQGAGAPTFFDEPLGFDSPPNDWKDC
jgi:hypothetical protein